MTRRRRLPLAEALFIAPSPKAALRLLERRPDEIDNELLHLIGQEGFAAAKENRLEDETEMARLGAVAAEIIADYEAVARFALWRGAVLQQLGDGSTAADVYASALDVTRNWSRTGPEALAIHAELAIQYASAVVAHGSVEPAQALRLLQEVQPLLYDSKLSSLELRATMLMAMIEGHGDQWAEVAYYASRAAALVDEMDLASEEAAECADFFKRRAWELYRVEMFHVARTLVEAALRLDPENFDARRLQAFALGRLEQYESAAAAWREIVAQVPNNAESFVNLAGALSAANHHEEAIEAIGDAMRIDPEHLQYDWIRARIRLSAGDFNGAIDDLTRTIAKNEEAAETYDESASPQTSLDFDMDLPPQALCDAARVFRLWAYRSAGDVDAVLAESRNMIAADSELAQLGLLVQAEVRSEDEPAEALALYTQVLEMEPDSADVLHARATLLLRLGRVDEAVTDLGVLARRDVAPDRAIPLLTEVLDAYPDHLAARRRRGFALLETSLPGAAVEDLTIVIDRQPDAESHLWRGQARLQVDMSAIDASDEPGGLTPDDILGAVEDFAHAVALGADDALHMYLWLVDRALANPYLETMLRFWPDQDIALFTLVPAARAAFAAKDQADQFDEQRDWATAAEQFHTAQELFSQTGLPISAIRLNLRIADNLMRIPDLQKVLDVLSETNTELSSTLYQPLTRELEHLVADLAVEKAKVGQRVIAPEHEYMEVYGLEETTFLYLSLLEAQVHHRLGDPATALASIGDLDEFFGDIDGWLAAGSKLHSLVIIIQMLRDVGRIDDAMHYLDEIAPYATEIDDRASIDATRASMLLLDGQADAAVELYVAARQSRADAGLLQLIASDVQLATALTQAERFDEAIALLDSIDVEKRAQSKRDQYIFYTARAQTFFRAGRPEETLEAVTAALKIAEAAREELHTYESRITWHGSQQDLFDWGVSAAVEIPDPVIAFELVERSKTRAFLDQLTNGRPPLPDHVADLVLIEAAVSRKLSLLEDLARQVDIRGAGFVDFGLVDQLRDSDPELRLTTTLGGSLRMDAAALTSGLQRTQASLSLIRERIDEARFGQATTIAGVPLPLSEVRKLLVSHNDRRSVLVEYYTTYWGTLLFVVIADDPVPQLAVIDVSAEDIADFAADHFGGGDADPSRLDVEAWQAAMGSLVEPFDDLTRPGDLVWLVPHGAMHSLPLHALRVGDQYLADRNPICYTSSASVLEYCRRSRKTGRRGTRIFADSTEDLPFAREEAVAIGAVMGEAPTLGRAVSKARVVRDLSGSELDIAHFACHALFDPIEPMQSGIVVASDEPANGSAELLTANDILEIDMAINLVTLSGCESALSEARRGDELIGLTRSLLYSGASSLLLSLWEVDDIASSLLIERFYTLYRGGGGDGELNKAEALQQAQTQIASLTAGEAIALCDARLASIDPLDTPTRHGLWLMARGDMHYTAASYAQALADYKTAAGLIGGDHPRSEYVQRATERARESLSNSAPRYDAEPFRHLADWAPFILIGDWR